MPGHCALLTAAVLLTLTSGSLPCPPGVPHLATAAPNGVPQGEQVLSLPAATAPATAATATRASIVVGEALPLYATWFQRAPSHSKLTTMLKRAPSLSKLTTMLTPIPSQ